MIKKLCGLLMACGLLITANAQDNKQSLFAEKELNLSLSTDYNVNNGFDTPYDFNLSVGAGYYITKYVGISTTVPFRTSNDFVLNNVIAGLDFRVPLAKRLAIVVSPQARYNWDAARITPRLQTTLEYRFNSKIGVFVGGSYNLLGFGDYKGGTFGTEGGIRFNLF
ncbi:MAG: hypothetical protein Q7R95_10720 [bacterium]|nr:hypothetical protein [bacterium]